MTGTPAYCAATANLGEAVELLWNRNCGFLPVVDEEKKVVGVVTDRDVCVALGTRNKLAGELKVGEVATRAVISCEPDDEVGAALATMAEARVRRLPVIDKQGKLAGVLSLDDIVMHTRAGKLAKAAGLSSEEVVGILNKVYRPNLPALVH